MTRLFCMRISVLLGLFVQSPLAGAEDKLTMSASNPTALEIDQSCGAAIKAG
jgi:hypothetical protein